jgi:hypothetical protein
VCRKGKVRETKDMSTWMPSIIRKFVHIAADSALMVAESRLRDLNRRSMTRYALKDWKSAKSVVVNIR